MTFAGYDWDEDERNLFQAGKQEAPSASSAQGVLAALGLEGPVGPEGGDAAPVSSVEPAGTTPFPPPAAPSAPMASGIFARPLVWAGAGVVALALIPAGLMWGGDAGQGAVSKDAAQQEEIAPVAPSATKPSSSGETQKAPAAASDEAVALSDLELIEDPSVAPSSKASAAEQAAQRPSLAEEIALIKDARAKLGSGDLAGCEAALAEHRQKFVPPRLSSEALVVRVELLVKRGKMAEARHLAGPLMKENSPYRARMETLLSSP